MKKNNSTKRGPQDGSHQSAAPEKVGWVRKFCGKGIFREIWKNRYVVLKGDQLYISDKEEERWSYEPLCVFGAALALYLNVEATVHSGPESAQIIESRLFPLCKP